MNDPPPDEEPIEEDRESIYEETYEFEDGAERKMECSGPVENL